MTEFFQNINWIDLLVVILLIRSSYIGFARGFGWEFFRFLGAISVVIFPIYFYEYGTQLIIDYFPVLDPFSDPICFTSLYIIPILVFKIINGVVDKIRVIKIDTFSILGNVGGLCIGFIRGCILLSLLLISLIFTQIPYFEKSVKERSYAGRSILKIAPFVYDNIAEFFPALKFGSRNEAIKELTGLQTRLPGTPLERAMRRMRKCPRDIRERSTCAF